MTGRAIGFIFIGLGFGLILAILYAHANLGLGLREGGFIFFVPPLFLAIIGLIVVASSRKRGSDVD